MTEALRTNRTGGRTVKQLIAEATRSIAFMSMEEVAQRIRAQQNRGKATSLTILDVRAREAFEAGHLPGAINIPRGELELRADRELPDPTARILTCCQVGKISTLAAQSLRTLGYSRAAALDGGIDTWARAGYPMIQDPKTPG